MKKERKDHPKANQVIFAMKIAAFLSFVVVPIIAWKSGQNFWQKNSNI